MEDSNLKPKLKQYLEKIKSINITKVASAFLFVVLVFSIWPKFNKKEYIEDMEFYDEDDKVRMRRIWLQTYDISNKINEQLGIECSKDYTVAYINDSISDDSLSNRNFIVSFDLPIETKPTAQINRQNIKVIIDQDGNCMFLGEDTKKTNITKLQISANNAYIAIIDNNNVFHIIKDPNPSFDVQYEFSPSCQTITAKQWVRGPQVTKTRELEDFIKDFPELVIINSYAYKILYNLWLSSPKNFEKSYTHTMPHNNTIVHIKL